MRILTSLAFAGLTLTAADVLSAQTYFFDRLAFQAASGALSTESFEGIAVALPAPSLTFGGFTVSEVDGTNAITSTAVNSVFGTAPVTDGNVAIWYDDNNNSIGQFQFGSSIQAFGLDVTVRNGGLMSVGGDVSNSFALATNQPAFFGVIWAAGFSNITFSAEGGPEVGFDYVQFSSAPSTVPEPSSFALFGIGGALLFGYRRRQRVS